MIFTQQLQRIDATNPQDAIKKMVNHLKYIQEQLEITLTSLDSRNIVEIDTDKTQISNSGTSNIGTLIKFTGENRESFTVGRNADGDFEFTVNGAGGKQMLYFDNEGKFRKTPYTDFVIDGGEW